MIGRLAVGLVVLWLVLIGAAQAVAPLLPSAGTMGFFSNDLETWRFGFVMQDIDRGTYYYPRMGRIWIDKLRASADGEQMAYVRVFPSSSIPSRLEVLDMTTGERTVVPHIDDGSVIFTRTFDISPDGEHVAYVERNVAYVYDRAADETTAYLERQYGAVDWSPDGKTLALTVSQGAHSEIMLLDIASGARRLLNRHPIAKYAPAFSPDGCCILYRGANVRANGQTALYIMQLQSGDVEKLTMPGTITERVVWSPDGTHIAYPIQTHGYGGSFIEIMNLQTRERRRLSKHPASHTNLLWVR